MGIERRSLGAHTTVLVGPERGKYPDGLSVLVQGRDLSVLVDPSFSVRSEGLTVDRVLLTHTHEDHVAGLSAVHFDDVGVHHADLAALRSVDALMTLYGLPRGEWPAMTELVSTKYHFDGWPAATGLDDATVVDLGGVTIRVIHAPGHTAGHSVLLVEPDGVLVCGDIDLTGFGPYYGDAASSLDDFERTLVIVREIPAAHYATFHHKGVVEGQANFVAAVDAFAAVIGRRSEAVLALLDRPRTLDELAATGIIYRPGTRPPVFGESVERYSIERHLARLVADGAVATDGHHHWRT